MGWDGEHRVVAVLGAKGGVGTSMLALNLAATGAGAGRLALLLDGAVASHPGAALLEYNVPSSPDRGQLLRAIRRGPGGVHLLPPVRLTPQFMETRCRPLFDVTVIDAAASSDQETAARLADTVVIVVAMMRPALHAARVLHSRLRSSGATATIVCVLNRNEANSDVDVTEAGSALDTTFAAHLPYDPALVASSLNAGAAFVETAPQADISRRIRALAATLGVVPVDGERTTSSEGSRPDAESARVGGHGTRLDRRLLRFGRR